MTTEPTKENEPSLFIEILRWTAVLPAAVAAFFAIQLVLILFNAMSREGWSDWWLQLINSGASGYCFVYVGALTAPRSRLVTGIVLAVLFGIFFVVITTSAFFIKTSEPLWWLILAGAISMGASIVAVVKVKEDFET